MPPAHSAVANRTRDWVRAQAAKVGVATAAYVERLLTGRDHIEQGVQLNQTVRLAGLLLRHLVFVR